MSHIKMLGVFYIVFFVFYMLFILPLPAFAANAPIKITDPIPSRFTWPPGEVYVDTVNNVNYQSGKMVLSSTPDGTGDIYADDAIDIVVNQGNQMGRGETVIFENNCTDPHEQLPKDVTQYFYNGDNIVHIKLRDICGGNVGSFALYLVNIDSPVSTPAPTPTPSKTPLIFIPGIGGSELKVKNDTHLSINNGHGGTFTNDYKAGDMVWVNQLEAAKPGNDDYFDVLKLKTDGITGEADLDLTGDLFNGAYGPTIKYFTDNGYTLNKDFFVFPYDWRKDILADVPLLDQKIQSIKQQTGASKVDIVAHSMGGLVARSYISDVGRAGSVRKYISLGTPYLGSTKLLGSLMYGNCLIYQLGPICFSINPLEVKDVLQNSSGAYQLAPSNAYYTFYNGSDGNHLMPFRDDRDIDNNNIKGSLNYDQTKSLLSNLKFNSSLYSFNESLHNTDSQNFITNGVDTTFIVGSGLKTIGQIVEGYAIKIGGTGLVPYKDLLPLNGDETTPLYSGSLNDSTKNLSLSGPVKVYYAKVAHGELPKNSEPLELVKNILGNINQIPGGISTKPYSLDGTQVSVHSPVNIDVYDVAGNHTGLTSDGDFEENIPGSSYETLDDAKFIWLPDAGKYTVKFAATDQGSFTYKVRTYINDKNTKTVLFNDVPLTTTTKGEEPLDTTTDPAPLQIDKNGDGNQILTVPATQFINGSEYDPNNQPSPNPTVTPIPSITPKPTPTPAPSLTPKPIVTPSPTLSPSPKPTVKPSPTPTSNPTPSKPIVKLIQIVVLIVTALSKLFRGF